MIGRFSIFLWVFLPFLGTTQTSEPNINRALRKFGFKECRVIDANDTIYYYLRDYTDKPEKLVVYIQGTDPNPLFSYTVKDNETVYYKWFPDDYENLDTTYTYMVIPKPGIHGLIHEQDLSVPEEYYAKNHLEYRQRQLEVSIADAVKNHLSGPNKIIVYGHSEGAVIAAALAVENRYITHLGFWSGNILNNFYEFALFERLEALRGNITDSVAHANILGLLSWYDSVIVRPESTGQDRYGYTNKRWSSYEVPPIDYLAKVDIPIYAVFATEDESTPIETAYLLPVRFRQERKENLVFKVLINCDHSYRETKNDTTLNHWPSVFSDFILWTDAVKSAK